MNTSPKFSIVTVSYNAVKTIEQTILRVLGQDYDSIEYIIIDGGSTDGTVDIIRKYEDQLAFWNSEPDEGMYDALAKGFERVTGDICAYINADDFYQPHAFSCVAEIMRNPKVKWLTGINAIYNEFGQIVSVKLPYRYRSRFIQKGLYNGDNSPFIQQESTFWRTELMDSVDRSYLKKLKFAGDYYLWHQFSKGNNLDIVSCILGGFRKNAGQLSENWREYRTEMEGFIQERPTLLDSILLLFDRLRGAFPLRFNPAIIRYDFSQKKWTSHS